MTPTPASVRRRGRPGTSLRLAVRLARRETVRRPGRTLLVALLVAMPVAGMTIAAVAVRTDHQTPRERWAADWGDADLFATPEGGGEGDETTGGPTLDALLPAGSRTVAYRSEYRRVLRTTTGERSSAEITGLPMAEPLVAAVMQVTSGRAPAAAGEIFLTRAVASQLDLRVGETVAIERPEPAEWTVVGVGERRSAYGAETVVLGPGTPFPWRDDGLEPSQRTVLIDLPAAVTADQLGALTRYPGGVSIAPGVVVEGLAGGVTVYADEDDRGDDAAVAWSWVIGAVVLTVVSIVIAAAFAAGARRQLATLGQLAANGASPAVLRRVLFLQGTWTGLFGAALGLGLAAALLATLSPHVDALLGRDVGAYDVRPADLVPIVALGVAAATLAALVPARTTARIPVLAALAGRRPLRPVPAWLPFTGVAVGIAGLALLGLSVLGANDATSGGTVWALTAIAGGVAVLLGACAVAPAYVSVLEPLAGRVRGASRLAARSLARQRTRTGAVVSAVCATSALAIAASALVLAADADADADQTDFMRSDEVHLFAYRQAAVDDLQSQEPTGVVVPDDLVAELGRVLPGAETYQLAAAGVPDAPGYSRWEVGDFAADDPAADSSGYVGLDGGRYGAVAAIVDETLLELYDLPVAARRALDVDGVVGITAGSTTGTATASLVVERSDQATDGQAPSPETLRPPFPITIVASVDLALGGLPGVLVTGERAGELGLEPVPGPTVVRADGPLTDEQRTAVEDIVEEHRDTLLDTARSGDDVVSIDQQVLYPSFTVDPGVVEAALGAVALLLSLFVVAVSLALAAAETRDERDVLVVMGAPPATMRRTSGRKALLLSGLGAVLAVPVGFLPVAVFITVSDNDLPLVFPWRVVLLLVVAVPVVAALVTTLGSRLALRLRPVRVSTMAFD